MSELSELSAKALSIRAKKTYLLEQQHDLALQLKGFESRAKSLDKAIALIQLVAKETQEKLKFHLEDICNSALDSVFVGKYKFIINFELKRGRTEADIFLIDEDGGRIDPIDSSGGGVVDIVSFALRLSAWTLSKSDNVLILDEPFKFLSEDLKPLAGAILKTLSHKLGLQILMVTHDEEMINIADKVFVVTQRQGKSIVEVR